ncbi:aminodeoxychorismate/anthranilate synthase component II [Chryseobacterium nematophagum]|uniref:Aminodeoxychorismate/anthranilate synthase component II n=1 Tax=Chryseobacterium nematophagum TaxID=2305228 RepID=A0A3M7TKV3_9FLAO|nr:aminodeoxychorismate/anthranilate synthase component II [Chryseobacterium nematophagum]RNA63537.1 aminodeoxychorismate/anthranilate synthase component II [Chryseobacterium nematophagum]
MKKILIIDNYDSFTYNLKQLVSECSNYPVSVWRNDTFELEEVDDYDYVILSPGPGIPQDAGQCIPLINHYKDTKKILGICLGHQAIGVAFGAQLKNTSRVYHGISTSININNKEKLYSTLPDTIDVARYHSWIVEKKALPNDLIITSTDDSDIIMSLRHSQYDITGVQYHPESFLTLEGTKIIKNWLEL